MENTDIYDIAIIGGGINGAGIAADASLRGLHVLLCDQNDLGSATSSASTKLIHGGLRYLEYYEFGLVRESLNEREVLLKNAKHLVKPLNFLLPHQPESRSALQVRLGLFLYDHLSRHSTLPKTKVIRLKKHSISNVLKPNFKIGFQYADCKTDDSRLVIANAMQAKKQGATILTYTKCTKATRENTYWKIALEDAKSGIQMTKKSKVLINATGPWVPQFFNEQLGIESQHDLQLVKGSHIVVPKFYQDDLAFIIQHTDTRVIFVIPYLSKFALIGTTDVSYHHSPGTVLISQEETDYLLNAVNTYFSFQLKQQDIVHSYSGLRPLLKGKTDQPAAISRDYAIEINRENNLAPLVSLFGGKLTTYRKLSEKVIDQLQPFFKHLPTSTTALTPLPGSDYSSEGELLKEIRLNFTWLEEPLLTRYLEQYGTHIFLLLNHCHSYQDLGKNFGENLYQREVDYLMEYEWAKTAEDILWRRTKLGYTFPLENLTELNNYIVYKTL